MSIERRRAHLIEYVPWILRDYFTNHGPATFIVVVLIAMLALLPVFQGLSGVPVRFGNVSRELSGSLLRALIVPMAFLGAFFATNGMIANDRKLGHYRFLFAKPVNPVAYYNYTFAAYGVGLLIVVAVVMALWSVVVRPTSPLRVLSVVALMYLAYGGIGYLVSAAWRFDWLSLITVIVVANVGWSIWGTSTSPLHWVLYALPPVHRADDVYALVLPATKLATVRTSALWLSGYGVVCFLLGMVIVRHRPLGTS